MKRHWKVYLTAAAALLLVACTGTKNCVIATGSANTTMLYAYAAPDGSITQGVTESDADGNITVSGVPDSVDCGSTDYRQVMPVINAV